MFSSSFLIWLLTVSSLKADDNCDSFSLLQTASSVHNLHSVPGRFFEDFDAIPAATAQIEARRQEFEAPPVARFDVGADSVPMPKWLVEQEDIHPTVLSLAQADVTSNTSKTEDYHSVIDTGRVSDNGTSQDRSQHDKTASEKGVPKVTPQALKIDHTYELPLSEEAELDEKVDNESPPVAEISSAEPPLPAELMAIVAGRMSSKGGDEKHNAVDGLEHLDVASKFVECLGDSSESDCIQDVQQKEAQAKAVARQRDRDPHLAWREKIATLQRQNAKLDAIAEINAEERSVKEEERTKRIMSRKLDALEMERRALLSQAAKSGWLTAPDDNVHMSGHRL